MGLKWNISTEMARAGERYLWCVVKANASKDQFSIGANKTSRLWHSVLLLPFYFFYFLATQVVMAKRPKGQERHLWYPTLTDVNGPSLSGFLGTAFVHSLPLGRVSVKDQVGRTLKKHLQQCKLPVPSSRVYFGCRRHSQVTAIICPKLQDVCILFAIC